MSPMVFKGNNDGEEPMDLVATHQRLLVGAALRTKGPILELGVGWYSTPILHEIAAVQGRTLWTIDNNQHWLAQFQCLECEHHMLRTVGWWGELWQAKIQHRFGLVFVDQGQPCEREYAVRALADRADVFVMHDTEEDFAYGYGRVLGWHRMSNKDPERPDIYPSRSGMFKYQYTDKCQKAWTTVASNVVDVRGWFIDLPKVEPSQEVT